MQIDKTLNVGESYVSCHQPQSSGHHKQNETRNRGCRSWDCTTYLEVWTPRPPCPSPAVHAACIASVRSATWSLLRMLETWLRTVLGLKTLSSLCSLHSFNILLASL